MDLGEGKSRTRGSCVCAKKLAAEDRTGKWQIPWTSGLLTMDYGPRLLIEAVAAWIALIVA
jgi:hypothetical protein